MMYVCYASSYSIVTSLVSVHMLICSYVFLIHARVLSSWYIGVLSLYILHMLNVYVSMCACVRVLVLSLYVCPCYGPLTPTMSTSLYVLVCYCYVSDTYPCCMCVLVASDDCVCGCYRVCPSIVLSYVCRVYVCISKLLLSVYLLTLV
jgi:hypothetical protein